MLTLIKTCDEVSSLETTSVNPIDAEIVGISMSFKENEAYYIPLSHSENTSIAAESVLSVKGFWRIKIL